jgi:RNA polymerase sigma-32 factor
MPRISCARARLRPAGDRSTPRESEGFFVIADDGAQIARAPAVRHSAAAIGVEMKRRTATQTRDLEPYLARLKRFSLLTAEEEQALARARGGDRASSLARLVTANLGFVVKVALEYRRCGLSAADLIQEGNIGLLKAAERFDPDRNVRFLTYAAPWIRASILAFIMRSFSLVRVGTTEASKKLFYSLARARREAGADHPLGEDDDGSLEIARKLKVKPGEVHEMTRRLAGRDVSLEALAALPALKQLEPLVDQRPGQDELLASAQEHARVRTSVRKALGRLDSRERFVVEQRVMLDAPATLADVGDRLRISCERTRQLESRATRKLRRELNAFLVALRNVG